MPRFSFPVPGRRHKQESAAIFPPPVNKLNKVQKILGSPQADTGSSPSLPTTEAERHWDTVSNSCISINISESALSHEESRDGGLSSLTEDTVVHGQSASRPAGFDEESGVLPRAFAGGDINTDFYGQDGRSITDASSLRRKQSDSTIISYYDKSKVPLVISQQTSNSAMAKGLPTKASSLLDIDGSISQASRRKKKPAKLDLSRMFTNRKSSSTMTLSADRGPILGPDMVTRSPSFMSVSPRDYLNRPLSSHRSDRKLRASARTSSREDLSGPISPKQKLPNQRYTAAQESTGLQNLYEHYEQTTFRNVLSDDEATSDVATPESGDEVTSPLSTEEAKEGYPKKIEQVHTNAYSQQAIRETPLYKDISSYLLGYGGNVDAPPQNEMKDLPTLRAPVGDCSESISSRHTRTSKASKRTAQSLLEIDLQQTSVLSLSSDSEDDLTDPRPKTSSTSALPSPRSQYDTAVGQEGHRPTTSRSISSGKRKKNRASARPENTVHFLPVPANDVQTGPTLPSTVYSRASSASASTNSTAKPSIRDVWSPSCDSRASVVSNKTVNSIGPANYTVHEARAITMIPAQGASYNSEMMHSHTSSSDQLTPPLSPSSMDFLMRSNRASLHDNDQGSVRSGGGSVSAAESSRSPSAAPGRFMAVTRQEELLLAALRKKRLRMRKSVIAEFEEEQENEAATEVDNVSHQPSKPVHEFRRTSIDAVLELHSPQPRSISQTSVSFKDFPMHFEDSAFPVPPSAGIRNSLRSSSILSLPLSPRSKPPTAQLPPTPTTKTTLNTGLDRVLMNLNNSTLGKTSSSGTGSGSTPTSDRSDDIFGGEPSPRLSDCLDFDDGGSGSGSIESYDSFNFETPANQSPIDSVAASHQQSSYKQAAVARGHHLSAGYRYPNSGSGQSLSTAHDSDDDYSIHIVDEPAGLTLDEFGASNTANNEEQGIPRPDSPLESPLPFPRKTAVRISAVGGGGRIGMEAGWWGDDG